MKIASIESDRRIQLPADWLNEFGLQNVAALEKTNLGILVRACPTSTWDEVYADKLPMAAQPAAYDTSEINGDDYLF